MSQTVPTPEGPEAPPESVEAAPSLAARLEFYQRAGGVITPLITAAIAFFIGGLVVLVSRRRKSTADAGL